ncbi:MAG: hypothetical protein RRZ84_05530 [Romboutsia sp.]|uniref:hypothetical protein n=1 Tax=Terrisporobacter sp. TaxID=1965305 RepID=UPI002FC8092D
MNYNMYPNKRADSIDPNYIYPQPYIDPLMYMNPYAMNNESMANYNANMGGIEYSTYSNQYADNPTYASYIDMNDDDDNYYTDDMYNMNNNMTNATNIPVMPPSMFPGMMFPGMVPPNMMPPGMMNQGMMVPPNMMYPGMMPYMNMMPNIPTINMEEFDEEEM